MSNREGKQVKVGGAKIFGVEQSARHPPLINLSYAAIFAPTGCRSTAEPFANCRFRAYLDLPVNVGFHFEEG